MQTAGPLSGKHVAVLMGGLSSEREAILVFEGANRPPQEIVAPSWTFGEEVMIEPYIRGKELAVGVMDGKAMSVTDIFPRTGFYDYEAKYAEGGSVHVVPAEIPPHAFEN